MVRAYLVLVPLAATLACSFDSIGAVSSGSTVPPSGTSESSEGGEDTAVPTDSGDPDTGVGSTTEPTGSMTSAVDPTEDASTGTTRGGCGDGVRDPGEDCDGGDLGGQACGDFGLVDGVLACAADCTIDTTGCLPLSTCGDGDIDDGEECDGDELGDQDCAGLGFELGVLACADNCAFDTSLCVDVADDWYDVKFLMRRKLTIPAAGVVGEHVDFPVVLALTDAAVLQDLTPADKLVFADSNKKVLSHEVELEDADHIIVWVELPTLSDAADSVFYVYYGNPDANDTADAKATWSNEFLAVWHLDEEVADEQTTGKHADATEGMHTGTQKDNQGAMFGVCRIGRCQEIGASDWIELDKDADFKLGDTDITIAAWIYSFNANMTGRAIFSRSNPAMAEPGHVIFGQAAPNLGNALGVEHFGAGLVLGTTSIANSSWHYAVWTQTKDFMAAGEQWNLYLDGQLEAQGLAVTFPAVGNHVARIGGPTALSSFPGNFQGRIDEVQVSTTDRSAEWVTTSYNNQRAPGMFTLVGDEETL